MPFLLKQTRASLVKAPGNDSNTLSTVAALHLMYSAFYSLSEFPPSNSEALEVLQELESHSRINEILEGVVGIVSEVPTVTNSRDGTLW